MLQEWFEMYTNVKKMYWWTNLEDEVVIDSLHNVDLTLNDDVFEFHDEENNAMDDVCANDNENIAECSEDEYKSSEDIDYNHACQKAPYKEVKLFDYFFVFFHSSSEHRSGLPDLTNIAVESGKFYVIYFGIQCFVCE